MSERYLSVSCLISVRTNKVSRFLHNILVDPPTVNMNGKILADTFNMVFHLYFRICRLDLRKRRFKLRGRHHQQLGWYYRRSGVAYKNHSHSYYGSFQKNKIEINQTYLFEFLIRRALTAYWTIILLSIWCLRMSLSNNITKIVQILKNVKGSCLLYELR